MQADSAASGRETWAQRQERERRRDAIRELAFQVAEHTALGDLNRVERVERDGWPCVKFSRPPEGHRCECGMALVPLPTFSKRWGMLPTWFCACCNLPGVIAACESVMAEVAA